MISSTVAQLVLTVGILIGVVFLLGFIADPIMNLYLDGPLSALIAPQAAPSYRERFDEVEKSSWAEHFSKGFASVGVLGFLKVLLSNPMNWLRLGTGGGGGRSRAARTGRDRAADISLTVIIIGVATFAYFIWKRVRLWSRQTLEKAGERVVDVQGHEEDDDEDDSSSTAVPPT